MNFEAASEFKPIFNEKFYFLQHPEKHWYKHPDLSKKQETI